MKNKGILEFPVSIYGNMEPVTDVLSRARCRIFYKGANRNGTFITDEFAKELISTLHYVPVKGIYEENDFTDHGDSRSEGRIYGIVPESNNFAWEQHLDEDGIERTYACTDVLIFSALYPEASDIVGKSQSMELYEPSLQYHAAIIQNQKYIVFEHGSFLGLQVLGDEVEPCFEGASFFTLQQTIQDAINKIKEYSNMGGQSEMKINFKLSDSQKHDYLWTLLNTEYNEESGWMVTYAISDIYDEYAIAYSYVTGEFERVYYKKDDETDSLEITERMKVYIVDVTEQEKATLDTLRKLNGDTYELVNENLEKAEENAANCVEFSTKIEELNGTISTLNTEVENAKNDVATAQADYAQIQEQNSALSEELDSLKAYKKDVEDRNKEAVIAEYADKLSEEILESYKTKFDEYTVEDLDMHLAYELKKSGSSVFEKKGTSGYVPKDAPKSGVEEILARYKR